MPEIDWSKPVEYLYYEGEKDRYYPVVHVQHDPDGSKFCVVRRPNGHHFAIRVTGMDDRVRNVRRKVKHKKYVAFALYKDGNMGACHGENPSDAEAKCRQYARDLSYEVRVLPDPIEWGADADE